MAQLPVSSSATQTDTQSPQSGAPSVSTTSQSASVQPGTASNLLNNGSADSSLSLHPTNLSTVSLTPRSTATVSTPAKTTSAPTHHLNPVLSGLAIGLFIVAVAMFWATGRMGKNQKI